MKLPPVGLALLNVVLGLVVKLYRLGLPYVPFVTRLVRAVAACANARIMAAKTAGERPARLCTPSFEVCWICPENKFYRLTARRPLAVLAGIGALILLTGADAPQNGPGT